MIALLLLSPLLAAGPDPIPLTPKNVGTAVTDGQTVLIEGEFVTLIADEDRHRWMIQVRCVGLLPADKFNPVRKQPFDVWVEMADVSEEGALVRPLLDYMKARETYRLTKPRPIGHPPVAPKLKFVADGKTLEGKVYGGAKQAY
jgi:hypothetical protein